MCCDEIAQEVPESYIPDLSKYQAISDIVQEITAKFGAKVLLDTNRFIMLVNGFAPQLERERKMLEFALDEEIAAILVNCEEAKRSDAICTVRERLCYMMSDEAIMAVTYCLTNALGWQKPSQSFLQQMAGTAKNEAAPASVSSAEGEKSVERTIIGVDITKKSFVFTAVVAEWNGEIIDTIEYTTVGSTIDAAELSGLMMRCNECAMNYFHHAITDMSIAIPFTFTIQQKQAIKESCMAFGVAVHFIKRCYALAYSMYDLSYTLTLTSRDLIMISAYGSSFEIVLFKLELEKEEEKGEEIEKTFYILDFERSPNRWDEALVKIKQMLARNRMDEESVFIYSDIDVPYDMIASYPSFNGLWGKIHNQMTKHLLHMKKYQFIRLPVHSTAIGAAVAVSEQANFYHINVVSALSGSILLNQRSTVQYQPLEVLMKNTPLPVSKTRIFSTDFDNQESIIIEIICDSCLAQSKGGVLGAFRFDGIAPAKAGIPRIEVTIDVDSGEEITLSARDITNYPACHLRMHRV